MGELGFKCCAVVFLLLSRFVFPAKVLFLPIVLSLLGFTIDLRGVSKAN